MVAFSSMSESKFLKKEDLDQERGNLVHIKSFQKQLVEENDDGTKEYKFTMSVNEYDKPMVLNATNRAILERIYGGDTEDCIGNPIVMYVDENVSYAGKLVGGIRLRKPAGRAAALPKGNVGTDDLQRRVDALKPAAQAVAKAAGVDDDDIPF